HKYVFMGLIFFTIMVGFKVPNKAFEIIFKKTSVGSFVLDLGLSLRFLIMLFKEALFPLVFPSN
ncbi:hypothetical protein, partial [Methanobacterium formicicum]|uniref:hypothetical protein n=1 Tax=Methanobacterium formicicum TaxID=2162 RepID=UPI002448870F